jgi:hypothetical protein
MNKIAFSYTKEESLTNSWARGFEMVIDGKKTGSYFNEAGFVFSAEEEGVIPMFAGDCGMLGCCGAYMDVKHEKDTVIWQKFWHGQCSGEPEPEHEVKEFKFRKDFIVKPPLVFNREEYIELAANLKEGIMKDPVGKKIFLEEFERYKSGNRFAA